MRTAKLMKQGRRAVEMAIEHDEVAAIGYLEGK